MDDATINRTIAERLGWRGKDFWLDPDGKHHDPPPRFASSLDAMAEAEASLTPEERQAYPRALGGEELKYCSNMQKWIEAWVFAPARVRALASIDATKGREANRGK